MNTIFNLVLFLVNFVLLSGLAVAGSKFEAVEGQNVTTIFFNIHEVDKADVVKISFKNERNEKPFVIAQKPWVYDDPPSPGVELMVVKDRLSVIIKNVSISRSGLYKVDVYTGSKVYEDTATLLVNKAPVSSTTSPPHFSSSPTPPHSSDLQWLYALIPVAIIFIILCVCFWKQNKIPCFNGKKESGSSSNVSVSMNGGGETAAALLTVTSVS